MVRAESAHEESGGFHLLEVNSPVHISRSTGALIAIVAGLVALAFYACHRRDIREEKALVLKREQEAKNDAHHVVLFFFRGCKTVAASREDFTASNLASGPLTRYDSV